MVITYGLQLVTVGHMVEPRRQQVPMVLVGSDKNLQYGLMVTQDIFLVILITNGLWAVLVLLMEVQELLPLPMVLHG